MKCKICEQKTTWDESFGRPCFIVCPHCIKEMARNSAKSKEWQKRAEVVAAVLMIGYQIESVKKKNKGVE